VMAVLRGPLGRAREPRVALSFALVLAEQLDELLATNDTVFSDLGGPGDANSFAWGFPFFLGRSVYVAVAGASTPGGAGPYFAY